MIHVNIFLFYMFVDFIGKFVLPIILGCLYVFVGTYGKQKSTLKTRPNITECEKRIRFACDLCSVFFLRNSNFAKFNCNYIAKCFA